MIFNILQIVLEQVNNYFEANDLTRSIVLENIALLDHNTNDDDTLLGDSVALTLVNIEEELTLKNISNYSVTKDQVNYKNPKVNLNLYIMFCANRSSYKISLQNIAKIIEFFQGKRVFNQSNTIFDREKSDMRDISHFQFIVDLYTPSFEEMNFIWGTLGGKQLPSVMYKLSVLEIEGKGISTKGSLITEITGNIQN